MKAAIYHGPNQPLTIEQVDIDEPKDREVLVRTVASGVCHSDLHFVDGLYMWPTPALLASTLALVTAWMMLLGPATESSSFVLLAPSLAWSALENLHAPAQGWKRVLLWGSCAGFAAAVLLGGFAGTVRVHGLGIHPWSSLLYFAYLLVQSKPMPAVAAEAMLERRLAA